MFFPEGAYGPTNNCVGIGQVLRERGHRVVFVIEESFAGTLEAQGFEERLMRLGPPPEVEEAPGQFWKDFIRETAPVFRKPTIEQLGEFIEPTFRALCDGARYVDDRLREIFDEVEPDVIVEDNVVCFPAIPALGPAVGAHRLVQPARGERSRRCRPSSPATRRVTGPAGTSSGPSTRERSPTCTGSSPRSARSAAAAAAGRRVHARVAVAEPVPLPGARSTTRAAAARGRPGTGSTPAFATADASVRAARRARATGDGALVYLSLGSLGSADVELMRRLVDVLSRSPHRFIVSKGPQAAEFELAANMWGEEFVPQPAILPLVDLVITHGGNNTTTECFHFGKPMVALPLFWDQYDNAQRIDETGFGVRLPTYEFEDPELLDAIDRLLGDDALRPRPPRSRRVAAEPGTERAADLVERLG